MQPWTSFKRRGRGQGRGSEALPAEPSIFGIVAAWSSSQTNSSHQMSKAAQRYLRAAASLPASMQSRRDSSLLPIILSSLYTAKILPEGIQLQHFEDVVRDKD